MYTLLTDARPADATLSSPHKNSRSPRARFLGGKGGLLRSSGEACEKRMIVCKFIRAKGRGAAEESDNEDGDDREEDDDDEGDDDQG